MIKIEKGISIPLSRCQGIGIWSALRQMEIGDSFVLPKKHQANIWAHAKKNGIKVVSRSIENGQIRVWRVK